MSKGDRKQIMFREPAPPGTPTMDEVRLAFAYEKVTIRSHGIEMDIVLDELIPDRSKPSMQFLTGRIRSSGAPRRYKEDAERG